MAGINPEEIDKIVISHDQWDHIGSLNHILKYSKRPDVYVPESVSDNLKNEINRRTNIIEVSKVEKICKNIWTTGELCEETKEQSLVIKTEKSSIIITNCIHPWLERIIEKSREFRDVYAIIGCLHDSEVDILNGIT